MKTFFPSCSTLAVMGKISGGEELPYMRTSMIHSFMKDALDYHKPC